jgi:ethanolamine ammonia-lyase small subunit
MLTSSRGDRVEELIHLHADVGDQSGQRRHSAADSLGIYLTAHPKIGRRDHARNCISNIHPPGGLDYHRATDTLTHLMTQARRLGITGTTLKDDLPTLPEGSAGSG